MKLELPDEVGRSDVANVLGGGHEVVGPAGLEVGVLGVELEPGGDALVAVQDEVEIASGKDFNEVF